LFKTNSNFKRCKSKQSFAVLIAIVSLAILNDFRKLFEKEKKERVLQISEGITAKQRSD
jgi:hypothetical protein